ncbi:MAG: hypothetical protein PHY15_01945 [Eubacteriales bacterium]|nr:hypothetical protein [Eubacteriales bacterium]MDD4475610.1 hypothetical protein [Eubacteriales bacterium]
MKTGRLRHLIYWTALIITIAILGFVVISSIKTGTPALVFTLYTVPALSLLLDIIVHRTIKDNNKKIKYITIIPAVLYLIDVVRYIAFNYYKQHYISEIIGYMFFGFVCSCSMGIVLNIFLEFIEIKKDDNLYTYIKKSKTTKRNNTSFWIFYAALLVIFILIIIYGAYKESKEHFFNGVYAKIYVIPAFSMLFSLIVYIILRRKLITAIIKLTLLSLIFSLIVTLILTANYYKELAMITSYLSMLLCYLVTWGSINFVQCFTLNYFYVNRKDKK